MARSIDTLSISGAEHVACLSAVTRIADAARGIAVIHAVLASHVTRISGPIRLTSALPGVDVLAYSIVATWGCSWAVYSGAVFAGPPWFTETDLQ